MIFLLNGKNLSTDEKTYFLDVKSDSWYKRYVNTALENNIISRSSHFNPNMSLTRVEGLKMILLSVLGTFSLKYSGKFLDVKSSDWFSSYTEYADRNGLIKDLENYFYPTKKLTRLEIMYILYKI
ncbi:MAG: S-layer homology domain-containing protein [Candidatus Gracilibacteria bacterium]|nr:S-layer homology domain-containing protein [Candidatus Gracilibacteria bacterium]